MMAALIERDCSAFGEALYDFNARVGEVFAPVQGGRYATPLVAEIVKFCRQRGVRGVGQSSWGPAVFAVTPDGEQANYLQAELNRRYGTAISHVFVTSASTCGAVGHH
jgi:predicted sugar kinase